MSIDDPDAPLRIAEAGRQRVLARLRESFSRQIETHPELGEVDPDTLERLVTEAASRAGASLWRISLAEGAVDEFAISVPEALAHPAVYAAEQLVDPPEQPLPVPETAGFPEPSQRGAPPEPEEAEPVATGWEEPGEEPAPAAGEAPAAEEAVGAEAVGEEAIDDEPAGAATAVQEPAETVGGEAAESDAPAGTARPQALRIAAVHGGGIETLKSGDKDIELRLSDAGLDVIKRSSGVPIGRLDWAEVTAIALEESRRGLRGRRRTKTLEVRTARGQATFELPGLTEDEAAAHLEPMLERLRESGDLGTRAQ